MKSKSWDVEISVNAMMLTEVMKFGLLLPFGPYFLTVILRQGGLV